MRTALVLCCLGFSALAAAGSIAAPLQTEFPLRASDYGSGVTEATLQDKLHKEGAGYCTMALKHSGFTVSDYGCTSSGEGAQKVMTCRAVAHCTGNDVKEEWRPPQASAQ